MKATYDPDVDILRILFSNEHIEESDEDKPGVIIDYGHDGRVVGIEILDAAARRASSTCGRVQPLNCSGNSMAVSST